MPDRWEPRLVRIREGTHRSVSRDTPGADRELLREDGTNKLLGPTESIPFDPYEFQVPVEEPPSETQPTWELSPETQELVEIAGRLAGEMLWAVGVKVVQHARPVVTQKASAFGTRVRRRLQTMRRRSERGDSRSRDPDTPNDVEVTDSSSEVDMSVAEFQEGCRRLLMAEQYRAQLRDLLSRARITDGDLSPELATAVDTVLEGKTMELDEASISILMAFLAKDDDSDPLQLRR